MEEQTYMLPEELSIYEVTDVYQELRVLLESEQKLVLDASAVEEIDSAGIQLLVWFSRWAENRGIDSPIIAMSDKVAHFQSMFSMHWTSAGGSNE
ncbi:STAS domain-containing protein [Vibrio sonorensis]|uniref:STAS domain-containing protein n=1 Tax=Vibrio sonorensis TaxID=1004316 RepID=UPI0008D9C864|nr:STAS domain-containing protein [Vibrio sonorensis]